MSFMDDKKIIKEGFIDSIIKSLITKPVLKKSSKFQNVVGDLNDALSEFEKLANAELKKANPKAKKIKVKKYKV